MRHFIPEEYVNKASEKALDFMDEFVSLILGLLAKHVTGTFVEVLTILLYMMFWLCEPFPISKKISTIMKQYLLLKGLASLGYAFFIWCVLYFLNIDLAIV